ncbi:MAG TPA: hypothetical protein EYN66_21095 [Myxococcales bacterium]|nr:hypothetical protein [Myxococcales bacterium]
MANYAAVTETYRATGHGASALDVRTQANGLAKDTWESTDTAEVSYPVGSVLVQTHRKAGEREVQALFVMEKKQAGYFPQGADWRYLVVKPTGVVENEGKLRHCGRCHVQARQDGVFGPPVLQSNQSRQIK